MHGIRFVAALALIYSNPLFAAEPSGNATPVGENKAQAEKFVRPPYVIQRPYRIEPPDVIEIKLLKLVPKAPSDPERQPVSGQYLVAPDGTINLRQYGVVKISGRTTTEAQSAIQDHLKQYLDSPELSVNVAAYNSKVYYVITTGSTEEVRRVPISGIVTVLDAVSQYRGVRPESWPRDASKNMNVSIVRPAPRKSGGQQTLPVDWDAITQGSDLTTNYQVLPGDRVYVMVWQTQGRNFNRARNGL
jgi:protein involved in polysaccharide export with SLBB domain